MNNRRPALLLTLLAALALQVGCQTTVQSHAPAVSTARLYDGLGDHTRPITTSSPEAQRYFDQGLTWTYAFNHDEAIRCFTRATELDPHCAMAWWGIALCHGPHINNPIVPRERRAAAWAAVEAARTPALSATPVERALVAAIEMRYSPDFEADRAPLDQAYADEMARLAWSHRDADLYVLAAEALMDLQPWDLWTRDGEPKGRTPAILNFLERAMEANPRHPGALHLYIHATEASADPSRAVPAAETLRTLVPAAGHLVHMPSHIDVRVGRWDLATDANIRAVAADTAYLRQSPEQGFYRVYMAHNNHFLAYSAMMEGRSALARSAAKAMIDGIPHAFIETSAPLIDPYTSIEFQVLVRFGKWDEVLAHPQPNKALPITTAMWRFARATALAAKNDVAAAEREQAEFRKAVAAVPPGTMTAINQATDVLAIADLVLEGEIAFRRGRVDDAVEKLSAAAEREDNLVYMEPPEWIQPVRHSLGAILLASGRAAEAEAVYQDDLARWPENGWGLFGLAAAQEAQKSPVASSTRARFNRAWKRADTTIPASCLCVQ